MTNISWLKSCPFCGKEARYLDRNTRFFLGCSDEDCHASYENASHPKGALQSTIDRWNLRLAAQQDAREAAIEECARTAEKAWPRAHTYASENADYYHGQDHAVRTVVEAIRKLKRSPEQAGE